jgi:glyoxylase-like metal-dependent hydrolase (beta-lactamase superfamily II)
MRPQMLQETVTIARIELPTPLPVGPVNAHVLYGCGECILVDCGPRYQPAWNTLLEGLAALGLSLDDVTGLVLTHGHVDHVGHTRIFQERGVPIYSHPEVTTWLQPGGPWDEYRRAFYERLYHEMGVPAPVVAETLKGLFAFHHWNDRSVVDVPLRKGDKLPPLPQFQVLEVPGHAQAAIALWNEKTGDLLAGDQVLPAISSNALIEPRPGAESGDRADRTHSLLDYRRSLREIAALPVRRTHPGHGETILDTRGLIEQRLAEQQQRRDRFYQLVEELAPVTAYELALAQFPKHRDQVSLILSETLGYLDWLASEGRVRQERDHQGVVRWTPV